MQEEDRICRPELSAATPTDRTLLGAVAGPARGKKLIAIAAGACEGVALGSNSLAALYHARMAEIVRALSRLALGARQETLERCLRGLGDLVLRHRLPEPQPTGRHRVGRKGRLLQESSPAWHGVRGGSGHNLGLLRRQGKQN